MSLESREDQRDYLKPVHVTGELGLFNGSTRDDDQLCSRGELFHVGYMVWRSTVAPTLMPHTNRNTSMWRSTHVENTTLAMEI